MARTKPRLKMPPGSLSQSSFSRASRNRKLMRVATTTSLGETSRSSRSRFRRSPKFPVAMDRPCPAEPARPKRGRREVASAAADGGAHSRKVWAPLDGTIGGGAKRVKHVHGSGSGPAQRVLMEDLGGGVDDAKGRGCPTGPELSS